MIKAREIIQDGFNIEDGVKIKEQIDKEIDKGEYAIVDFFDVELFTISFFNACVGTYVIAHSKEWFKQHIKFVNLNEVGEVLCNEAIEFWGNKFRK